MSDLPAEPHAGESDLPRVDVVQALSSSHASSVAEPRGLTLADLLALLAGISIALATIPMDVRGLLHFDSWDRDRFPDLQARMLLVFLLGCWIVDAVCIAILPAVLWRQVRHRRMPYPGEWLAATLLLAPPLIQVTKLISRPLDVTCRWLNFDGAFVRDDYSMSRMYQHPADVLVIGGIVTCVGGLWFLNRVRTSPPVFKTIWISLLVVIYATLPAQRGPHCIFDESLNVPQWNSVSWQEFQTTSVDVRLPELLFLPVGMALAFVGQTWFRQSERRWCWTEWTGVVMFGASVALFFLLLTNNQVDAPDWQRLLVLVAVAFALSLPIPWCWKRWWA